MSSATFELDLVLPDRNGLGDTGTASPSGTTARRRRPQAALALQRTGSPSVVFEAGASAFAIDLTLVQRELGIASRLFLRPRGIVMERRASGGRARDRHA